MYRYYAHYVPPVVGTYSLDWSQNAVGKDLVYPDGMQLVTDIPAGATMALRWPIELGDSTTTTVSLTLTLASAGTVSFYRKVSSENNFDFLRFFIDGVQQAAWAGEQAWAQVSYAVAAGAHTFEWRYTKDSSTVAGQDTAWIALLSVTNVQNPPPITGSTNTAQTHNFEDGLVPAVFTGTWTNSTDAPIAGLRSLRTPASPAHSTTYTETLTPAVVLPENGCVVTKWKRDAEYLDRLIVSVGGKAVLRTSVAAQSGDLYAIVKPNQTVTYSFAKDLNTSVGADACWIDDVIVPFQIASGLTAVGRDLGTVWDTRAAVGDPLETIWDARASVSDDLVVQWDSRVTVADALDAQWDARQVAGDDVAARWDTKAVAGDVLDARWDTKALASDDMQAIWDIRTAAGDVLDVRWDDRSLTNDPLVLLWNVDSPLTTVGRDLGTVWHTRAIVGDVLDVRWDARTSVSDALQTIWDARAVAGDPVQLAWDAKVAVGDSLAAQWVIWQSAGGSTQALWSVRVVAGREVATPWNTRAAVGDGLGLVWDVNGVLTVVGRGLDLLWVNRARVGSNTQAVWNARQVVADTLETQWATRTTVGPLTVELLWTVRVALAGNPLVLVWMVEAVVGDSLALAWDVGVAPDTRTPSLARTHLIAAEVRVLIVAAEVRVLIVAAENRTHIATEARTLEVTP